MPRMKLPTQPNTCAWPCACNQPGEMEAALSRPLICRRFHTPRNVPGKSMKKSPEVTKAMSKRDNASSRARTFANISAGERVELRASAVARSASEVVTLGSLRGDRSFSFHGARKENVVLEMHVKVQILLEFFEPLIRCLIARTTVRGRLVSAASRPDLPHQFAGRVVFFHH